MTVKQVFYIFLQVVGMLTFVAAGVAGTLIYIGAQKKQTETISIEKPVRLTPESEPELKELTPVSFSQPTNGEKMADVKRKAKSRPAQKPAQKPVTYSTPKKVAPVEKVTPVEKPKPAATKKAEQPAKTAKVVPASQKPVAPSKAQIRNMAIKSADRMDYSAPEFRAALKEAAGVEMETWEQTKVVALSSLKSRSAEIEENEAWSMKKKKAAAEAIRKQQSEKNALQKFFGL